MGNYNTLLFDVDDKGIAVITINRPDKLNALNSTVLDELDDAIRHVREDDGIHGAIITGSGEKAFVAGADIGELAGLDRDGGQKASERGQLVFEQIEKTPKPVIAAVEGFALGGGCELALACHMRVAGGNAAFGLPETGLGLLPGYGGTQRLTALIGRGRALQYILTGDQIKAEQAEQYGLVNVCCEAGKAQQEAVNVLSRILKKGPLAVSSAIEAVYAQEWEDRSGFQREAELFGRVCNSEDSNEGCSAFLEKRKPEFKGK